ncbi:MAG: hypothetical protein GY871_18975 [Actinomycetales bacterium]|jgi:hypothetical protein|nr:hypothetical protein [Actinomycetales bacterium]
MQPSHSYRLGVWAFIAGHRIEDCPWQGQRLADFRRGYRDQQAKMAKITGRS